MGRKIQISQCMIVKNEEKNIERALSWGREIVCEQIVVDTGSTDRTVELASAMVKEGGIYHILWQDDFAAAKNYAISKAKGEWIAFLDADEEFAPGDEKKLLKLLESLEDTGVMAIGTGWMQLDDQGKVFAAATQVRVFRNRPGLGYRRRIHEQLEWSDGRRLRIADATKELSILHRGYCSQVMAEKNQSQRNLKLIQKELSDHPDDYEMLGYLGDEYYTAGQWDEAEQQYGKAVALMPSVLGENDQRSAFTFLHLMELIGRRHGREEEYQSVYERAVRLLPQEADFDYCMGCYCVDRKNYEKGALYFSWAFEKLERYGSYNKAMVLIGNLREAYEMQALCFLESGQTEKAVSASVAVLKTEPYSAQALYLLMRAFQEGSGIDKVSPQAAMDFLQKIYDIGILKDRLMLLRVSIKAGWPELQTLVEHAFSAEELDFVKRAEAAGGQ